MLPSQQADAALAFEGSKPPGSGAPMREAEPAVSALDRDVAALFTGASFSYQSPQAASLLAASLQAALAGVSTRSNSTAASGAGAAADEAAAERRAASVSASPQLPGGAASPPPCLRELRLSLPKGRLTCVVGEVGSGKSSLLAALLGELHLLPGGGGVKVARDLRTVPAAATGGLGRGVGYVAQAPFIMRGSVRDNVRLGLPFNPRLMQEVRALAPLVGRWGGAEGVANGNQNS